MNEHTFVNECMDEEEKFIVVNGIQNKLMVELEMNGQSNKFIEWKKS